MANPAKNPLDPRSDKGIFARGQNVYEGSSTRPNPEGNNQYGSATPVDVSRPLFKSDSMGNVKKLIGQDLQNAAKLRLRQKGLR